LSPEETIERSYLDSHAVTDFNSTIFRARAELVDDSNAFVATDLPGLSWVRHYSISKITNIFVQMGIFLRPRQVFSITPMSEWQTPEWVLEG
jgi:hypothetical protein